MIKNIKNNLFLIILSTLNIIGFTFDFCLSVKSDFLFLKVHTPAVILSFVSLCMALIPSLLYLLIIKFTKPKHVARRIFNVLIIVLSIIIFFFQNVFTLITTGPFISYTNDVANFGKYDENVIKEIESENIEPIFDFKEYERCIEYEYNYSRSMFPDAKINFTLKYDEDAFLNEQLRLNRLMEIGTQDTYTLITDDAKINVNVYRNSQTIEYKVILDL